MSIEMLDDLKWKAFRIKPFFEGKDAKWTDRAIAEYEALVDRFFSEYEEMITPQQYEAAKQDFEYFVTILTLTEAHIDGAGKEAASFKEWHFKVGT
ncbi:MAG: hypothetical protein CSYNP_04055 [Syntrophus sp. SKADARSKE-3]|nr:hypothetical protein [Syntrophus sp. SKADARSKE-3]